MESNDSYLPITEAQLAVQTSKANAMLKSVKWHPKRGAMDGGSKEVSSTAWRGSSTERAKDEEIRLHILAHKLCGQSSLLTEEVNHVMNVIYSGLRIGMHLSAAYNKFSNLGTLVDQNGRGHLTEAQKTEFRAKYATASAAAVFSAAYYVVWDLTNYKTEEVGNIQMDFDGVPEVSLKNPARALDCMMFYFGAYVERSGKVNSSLDFVKMALLYFTAVLNEINLRAESLQYTEPFTSNAYRLEGSDFSVEGFEAELDNGANSIEFNRVDLHQIVGNQIAKHEARRLVERMMCYDLATQRNPIMELGGFPAVRMGYGPPGTGKSMLISAIATMLGDWCKDLNIPFLFWPMPDTVISTFQGGSAERMMNWMRPLRDPTKLIYAPIDDAENNLEERSRQGVSAGVREVIAVFLRNTEGAYAVNNGSWIIDLFTNLPDQIDKAVLSRIRSRFIISGAESWEDFLDQNKLWIERYGNDANLIGMTHPHDYEYFSAQQVGIKVQAMYEEADAFSDERIEKIIDQIDDNHKIDEFAFFAKVCERVKVVFPTFTSRDVRNIQEAVDGRVMDFDLPDEWMEDPNLFFLLDHDSKLNMLLELRRDNMKGLTFHEIFLQECRRYFLNMIRIVEEGKKRQLEDAVGRLRIEREAQAAVLKEIGS